MMRQHFRRMFILFPLLLLLVPLGTTSGQQNPVAALDPIQGLVQYRPADAPEDGWETLTRVQLVSEGDSVRTDNLGLAELAFFDGHLSEILPNTLVNVALFDFVDADSPDVTVEVAVGDMRHQIDQVLDAESRYEVHTPSAVITVRGTNFWSSANWLSETWIKVLEGITEVKGVSPEGLLSPSAFAGQNQQVPVPSIGQPGQVEALDPAVLPQYPPRAPLAPATCGNLICDAGENEANCALDCKAITTCGNGVCELDQGEGPVTCAQDCVPRFRLSVQPDTDNQQSVITEPTATPIPQPCTVQAIGSSVGVRVGPGFNRSIRTYLETNTQIPVVGVYTDPQGLVWWKIHPPGYLQAEENRYWVLSDEVEEFGDCGAVPPADPSQIIAPAPPTPAPQATPLPGVTPLPTQPGGVYFISFYADSYLIKPGECTTVRWSVEGIREVYYQGRGVVGNSQSTECPYQTTTYELRVVLLDGSTQYRYVTIEVSRIIY